MCDKRAPNFTKSEESLLVRVVNSHSCVIENKKTDATTNKMKSEEWKMIADEFNALHVGVARDSGTLKRKYENLKRGVKQKLGQERKSVLLTGGGPEEPIKLDAEQIQLLEVQSPLATPSAATTPGRPPKRPWFNSDSAASLRTSPHPVLKQAKKNSRAVDKMSSCWAASKNDSVHEKLRMKKEEHNLKMMQIKEEGELRKKLLQQQFDHAEEQQSWLREEHDIKMARLKEGLDQ